jgi:hypothetical protein
VVIPALSRGRKRCFRSDLYSIRGARRSFSSTALPMTHGPIIEAAMPDIFAFFAKHTKKGR